MANEEKKEDQAAKLLGDVRQELRDIKSIQQTMGRNFNALVVMVIFGLLMFLVFMFFGDVIGREVNKAMSSGEGGRAVGEQFDRIERGMGR